MTRILKGNRSEEQSEMTTSHRQRWLRTQEMNENESMGASRLHWTVRWLTGTGLEVTNKESKTPWRQRTTATTTTEARQLEVTRYCQTHNQPKSLSTLTQEWMSLPNQSVHQPLTNNSPTTTNQPHNHTTQPTNQPTSHRSDLFYQRRMLGLNWLLMECDMRAISERVRGELWVVWRVEP